MTDPIQAPQPATPAQPKPYLVIPGISSQYRPAMKGGKMVNVHQDEVEYEMPDASLMFTDSSNLVPAMSTIKGARTFLGSKLFVQAMPIVNADAPYVDNLDYETGLGYSRRMGMKLGIRKSPVAGQVMTIKDDHIKIKDQTGQLHEVDLDYFYPHNRKTYSHDKPMVKLGDIVQAGQSLAHSNYVNKDGDLAMGKNLRVAFMAAPHGASFEDSIVLSQSAAGRMMSQHMYGYDVEHKLGVESNKKKFVALFPNKYTNDQLKKIDDNGMLKPGSVVEPGDPVFLSYSPRSISTRDEALGNLSKAMKNAYLDRSQTWEKPTQGQTVDAVKTKGGLRLNVVTNMPLRIGDKVSSPHGAKGVVGMIIPDEQMYRDGEGNPIDVIINPAALIGRVNPGMIHDALLGKIAHKTGKRYVLPAFAEDSYADFVKSELARNQIGDTDDLIDPVSGKNVPGVLNGYQHFLKLEHTSESKIHGRGEGLSDVNEQPAKGLGTESAKRIGFLETNALLSAGAPNVLRDIKVYRGTRYGELWKRIRTGESLPPPKVPFIYHKFLNSLRAGGIRVDEKGGKVNVLIMTDKDVDQMAPQELQNPETVNSKTGDPIPGGLFDPALHGGPDGRGWSHIKLPFPVPSPMSEEVVRSLLGVTQPKFRSILAGKDFVNGETGPQGIYNALSKIDLSLEEERARQEIKTGRVSKRDDAVKKLKFITGLKNQDLKPADLMITKVPVIPPTYRPVSFIGDMVTVADANYLYRDLAKVKDAYGKHQKELPEDALQDERLAVYDAVKAIQGMGDPIHEESQEKGVKGFLRQVSGEGGSKTGMFMSKVFGHTVDTVGRATIIPDSDLNMDEVGVPEKMAWKIFEPFVMRRMVKDGMPATQAAQNLEKRTDMAKRYLLQEMDNRPIMYTRAPAWHRYSIMGAYGRLVPGDNIRVSPLIVKPFGADFDGDAMNVHVPIGDDAVHEIKTKLLPSQNLLSIKDRKVHYVPDQEFVLGMYNISRPNQSKPMRVFASRAEATAAYKRGEIDIDTPVSIAGI